MPNNKYVKVKDGAKQFIPLLVIGTAVIGGYALLVRIFFTKGK